MTETDKPGKLKEMAGEKNKIKITTATWKESEKEETRNQLQQGKVDI